jgi:hypothetical protein
MRIRMTKVTYISSLVRFFGQTRGNVRHTTLALLFLKLSIDQISESTHLIDGCFEVIVVGMTFESELEQVLEQHLVTRNTCGSR